MCSAAGCDRRLYARGHCSRHYKQLLRHGEVQPDRAPAVCRVASCDRAAVTRGWCHGHYLRVTRQGDVKEHIPLTRPVRDICSIDGCERGGHSGGYCRTHARREQLYGDPLAGGPPRTVGAGGSLSHGYWKVPVPLDERHLVPPGRNSELEHRLVMARQLGRPLLAAEVVHHINGDRLDNRPGNLELCNTTQPKGQRVEDKLSFAFELIRLYDPEACRTLGLDLDPETGMPWQTESPPSR